MTHSGGIPGRLPDEPKDYNVTWAAALVAQLERVHRLLSRAISVEWKPTNVTESRTFDADTVTTAELADIVGTLIEDMKERGMLGD